jgi:hypothetical protein
MLRAASGKNSSVHGVALYEGKYDFPSDSIRKKEENELGRSYPTEENVPRPILPFITCISTRAQGAE